MNQDSQGLSCITPLPAVVKPDGDNYLVTIPGSGGSGLSFERNIDFGLIPGTKKPCLFKAGAEKIVWGYGLSTQFSIESAIEDYVGEVPFFYFRVKCSFYKQIGDQLYHITDGYGCANSNESACGRASKFDVANARLKIAKKRALVDGAILVGQLSGVFAQDIENEDFMKDSEKLGGISGPDDPITSKQIQRIYAICAKNGIGKTEAKARLEQMGYASTKDIKQKDYDTVCAALTLEDKKDVD